VLIREIQKNSTEKIRANVSEYKGYKFLPIKKGFTVGKDDIDTLVKLLTEGKKKLEGLHD
jgi:hypothetical protein